MIREDYPDLGENTDALLQPASGALRLVHLNMLVNVHLLAQYESPPHDLQTSNVHQHLDATQSIYIAALVVAHRLLTSSTASSSFTA